MNSNCNLKTIEKQLNFDLKSLFKWLCASKISLNVTKTEVVLFHHNNKNINHDIKLKLNGKHLEKSKSVKYLGVKLDQHLSFDEHLESLSSKLRSANGAISKIRHVTKGSVLKSVFNSLFSSHVNYANQTWGQSINMNNSRIFKLQKSAVRLLTFSDYFSSSQPLFLQLKLLKVSDEIKLQNVLLIHDTINEKSPPSISDILDLKNYDETHSTRGRNLGLLTRPLCKTTKYGINSITYQSILNWNELQLHHQDIDLAKICRSKLKKLTIEFYLSQYLT